MHCGSCPSPFALHCIVAHLLLAHCARILPQECPDGPSWEAQPVNTTSDCAVWLGSGSVWPRLAANGTTLAKGAEEWVINYSQQYNCGGGDCQAIFFASSTDLVNWSRIAPDSMKRGGNVFQVDPSLYAKPGRWDTLTVLPREVSGGGGGGYWGYWTATPHPSPHAPVRSPCAGKSCGTGFGWSPDGLNWTALPTPGPFTTLGLAPEVGGVARLDGKIWMLHTYLFHAPTPNGTFVPQVKNFDLFGCVVLPCRWWCLHGSTWCMCIARSTWCMCKEKCFGNILLDLSVVGSTHIWLPPSFDSPSIVPRANQTALF